MIRTFKFLWFSMHINLLLTFSVNTTSDRNTHASSYQCRICHCSTSSDWNLPTYLISSPWLATPMQSMHLQLAPKAVTLDSGRDKCRLERLGRRVSWRVSSGTRDAGGFRSNSKQQSVAFKEFEDEGLQGSVHSRVVRWLREIQGKTSRFKLEIQVQEIPSYISGDPAHRPSGVHSRKAKADIKGRWFVR